MGQVIIGDITSVTNTDHTFLHRRRVVTEGTKISTPCLYQQRIQIFSLGVSVEAKTCLD